MRQYLLLLVVGFLFSGTVFAADAASYPGRATYPMVKIYDTAQLNKAYDDVIIVDVRSKFEYETMHINNAINIPVGSRQFAKKVAALNATKPIVFYCNGHRCYHSYKAVLKAKKAGIKNIFSYDSGVFDWAKAYPEKATLMGETPVDLKQLISKKKLKKHLLEPAEFSSKITDKSVILDIREAIQRGMLELYPFRQKNIALSEKDKLIKFFAKFKEGDKTLMVYDEGGTQVRWVQYYLEDMGVSRYLFMKGGAKQYFKDMIN